jgi:hypothetical protein
VCPTVVFGICTSSGDSADYLRHEDYWNLVFLTDSFAKKIGYLDAKLMVYCIFKVWKGTRVTVETGELRHSIPCIDMPEVAYLYGYLLVYTWVNTPKTKLILVCFAVTTRDTVGSNNRQEDDRYLGQ